MFCNSNFKTCFFYSSPIYFDQHSYFNKQTLGLKNNLKYITLKFKLRCLQHVTHRSTCRNQLSFISAKNLFFPSNSSLVDNFLINKSECCLFAVILPKLNIMSMYAIGINLLRQYRSRSFE